MKPSTKDQIEGKLHEVKGKVREQVGQITNNPDLAAEGQADDGERQVLSHGWVAARYRDRSRSLYLQPSAQPV